MTTARSSIHALFIATTLAVAGAACASAGAGDGADASANAADADPNAPDADPNAPDADPNAPDANTSNNCVNDPCDLVPQCGCPGGMACDLDGSDLANGGTECRAINTAGTETSTCGVVEDCDAGYICVGGGTSHCRKYCSGDSDCTGLGSLCLIQITYGSPAMDVPGAKTCTKDCDPVSMANPTGCPSGFACHIYLDDSTGTDRFLTDCTTAGAGTDGADCDTNGNLDCAPGYDCINVGGTPQCKQTCIYGGGTVCQTGSCTRFAEPRPLIGGVEYGLCN